MVYGFDKIRAEDGGRRVRESSLLTLAFWGASPGALIACRYFRHKTRKQPFASNLFQIAVIHVLMVGGGIGWFLA